MDISINSQEPLLPQVCRAATAEFTAKTRQGSKQKGILLQSPNESHGHGHGHGHSRWGGHDHDPSEHVGDSSYMETVWNIANLVVGGGVLSMPYACKLAGWAGIGVIIFFAALFGFTAVLIGNVLSDIIKDLNDEGTPKEKRDFAMLAHKAFGRRGAQATALFLIAENWSAAVAYIIFVGANVQMTTGAPVSVGVWISGILSLFMLYMPLRWLSYLGMMGMLFASVAVVTLVMQGASDHTDTMVERQWLETGGLGTAGGIVLFCFAGHACLPNLYWSMRHPTREYTSSCVTAYSIITVFYGTAAAAGYYYFGNHLSESFTGSLYSKHLQWIAVACILVKIQIAVPPALAAPVLVVENMLGLHSKSAKAICRLVTVLASIVVALFCSGALAEFVALSGYLTTCYDSLIFPSLVALRLWNVSGPTRVMLMFVAVLGVVIAVLGTWAALAGY